MPATVSSNVVNITGNNTDWSDIISLASTTNGIDYDNNSNQKILTFSSPITEVNLNSSATLNHDPDDIQCVFKSGVEFIVNSTYNFGLDHGDENGVRKISQLVGLVFEEADAFSGQLKGRNSFSMSFIGGIVLMGGNFNIGNWSNAQSEQGSISIDNTEFLHSQAFAGRTYISLIQCYIQKANTNINNVILNSVGTPIEITHLLGFNNFSATIKNGLVSDEPFGTVSQRDDLIYNNLIFSENRALHDIRVGTTHNSSNKITKLILNNTDVGTDLNVFVQYRHALIEHRQDVQFQITDNLNNNIENVISYARLNGSTANSQGRFSSIDYTTSREYTSTTDGNGLSNSVSYLIGTSIHHFTTDNVENNSVEFLTKDANNNVDVTFYSYNHVIKTSTFQFRGVGTKTFNDVLVIDNKITETDKTIVSAYTELENADKLVDYDKYHKTLNANKLLPTILDSYIDINGTTIDFGSRDVIIDPTATSIYTPTASSVTIKASSLSSTAKINRLVTNGTYSEINGASLSNLNIKDTNGVRVTFNLNNGDIIKGKYGASDTVIPFETVTGEKRITIPENTAITLFVKRDGQREQVISTNSEQGKNIDFTFTALDGVATTLSWINDINVSFVDNADDTLDKLTINFDGTNNIPDLETNMTNTIVNHIQSQEAYADLCLSRGSARFFRIEPNLNMHIFNVDVDFTLDDTIATNINCRIPMYTTNATIDTPKNTHVDKNLMIFYFLNSSPDIDYNLLQLRVNEASNVVDIKNKVDSMDINALANTQSTILQEIAKVPEMNIGMKINVHESNITVPVGESVYFVVQGSDFEDELGKIRDVANNTWVTESSANNDVLISTTLVNNYYVADNPVSPCVKRECFVVTHDIANTFDISTATIHKTLILGCS